MTLVLMHIINQYTVNHSDYTDVNEKKKKKRVTERSPCWTFETEQISR